VKKTLKTNIKVMIIPYGHYAHNVCKHHNVQHNSLLAKNNSFFMLFNIKRIDYHECYHDKSLK
jgi:hypothetical protein